MFIIYKCVHRNRNVIVRRLCLGFVMSHVIGTSALSTTDEHFNMDIAGNKWSIFHTFWYKWKKIVSLRTMINTNCATFISCYELDEYYVRAIL